jgi:hypothetical protein
VPGWGDGQEVSRIFNYNIQVFIKILLFAVILDVGGASREKLGSDVKLVDIFRGCL